MGLKYIMDDETKAAFAELMELLNNTTEKLLDQMTALRHDFQNTKGFLLEDAIVTGRRMMSLEDRMTALERRLP